MDPCRCIGSSWSYEWALRARDPPGTRTWGPSPGDPDPTLIVKGSVPEVFWVVRGFLVEEEDMSACSARDMSSCLTG